MNKIISGVASMGAMGGQSAPLDSEKIVKNQEKEEKSGKRGGKSGKREEKLGKNQEKEEKLGRKCQSREGSFTLPLLTNRAGYATENNIQCPSTRTIPWAYVLTYMLFFINFDLFLTWIGINLKCVKMVKNQEKERKNWEKIKKKWKNWEENAKVGKVLLLCLSWQIGLATLLRIIYNVPLPEQSHGHMSCLICSSLSTLTCFLHKLALISLVLKWCAFFRKSHEKAEYILF